MSKSHGGRLLVLSLLVLGEMASSTLLQNNVDGTRELVVGSANHTSEANKTGDNNHENGGVAYKDSKVADVWSRDGAAIDGETRNDQCGSGKSVAMSGDGNTIAIGAPSDGHHDRAGCVRVHRQAGGNWSQVVADIGGEAKHDKFGSSVAMNANGTTIAVGAPFNDGNFRAAGHVRVYREADGNWRQIGADIDGEGDYFGQSVAMSADGTTIAIGAPSDGSSLERAGYVRVYREADGKWRQTGADIGGEAGKYKFGDSVAMNADGNTIAIGAPNIGSGVRVGYVSVHRQAGGNWSQVVADIGGEAKNHWFGSSVAMNANGTTIAVGALSSIGRVRVDREADGKYRRIGGDISSETDYDDFGRSVAMSADGTTIAIGAPSEGPLSEGDGYVRIYREADSNWRQIGADIDGEAKHDAFGDSIAIGADGNTIAVGAQGLKWK